MIDTATAATALYGDSPKQVTDATATPIVLDRATQRQQSEAPKSAAEKLYGGPTPYSSPFADKAEPAKPEGEKPQPDSKAQADASKEDPKTEAEGDKGEIDAIEKGAIVAVAVEAGFDGEAPLTVEFAEVATKLGADGAEKLLDLQRRSSEEAWDKLSDSWKEEAQRSPTFRIDVDAANELLHEHAHPELLEYLTHYRAANHPDVIKFLGKVGRALKGQR